MARGQRTNLAALATAVGDNSPVEQSAAAPQAVGISAPLSDLTANPRNLREGTVTLVEKCDGAIGFSAG